MLNFIVNPTSSSGNAAKVWKKVSKTLAKRQITYNAHLTTGPGSATDFARQICKSEDNPTIVVLGGDGTVNETLTGIDDLTKVTFGYIPAGSANDLAKALSLTTDTDDALSSVLDPKDYIMLDVGRVKAGEDERSFAVSCGIGYDASICHEALKSNIKDTLNKFHLGSLTYVIIALKQLIRAPRLSCTITLDDGETLKFTKYLFISVMNTCFEGGGLKFCPDAKYDDGILDICCAHNLMKLKVLRILPTAYKGEHTGFKGIELYRAKKVVVTSSAPAPVHADGESNGIHSEMVVTLNPGQLKMIYSPAK